MTTRDLLLCAFVALGLLLPAPARANGFEVEVDGGYGGVTDAIDPVLSVRAGLDFWGFFTPGVRLTSVLGPGRFDPAGGTPADRAWALLAEARFHTPGRVQAVLDLGAGTGRLVHAQFVTGDVAPAYQVGAGLRGFVVPTVAIGGGFAVMVWTGTHLGPSITEQSKVGSAFWVNVAAVFGR